MSSTEEIVQKMIEAIPAEDVEKIKKGLKRPLEALIGEKLVTYERRKINEKYFGDWAKNISIKIETSGKIPVPECLEHYFEKGISFQQASSNFKCSPYTLKMTFEFEDTALGNSAELVIKAASHFCITNPITGTLKFVPTANEPSFFAVESFESFINDETAYSEDEFEKKFFAYSFWVFFERYRAIFDTQSYFNPNEGDPLTIQESFVRSIANSYEGFITLEELNSFKK